LKTSKSLKERSRYKIIDKICGYCEIDFQVMPHRDKIFCSAECSVLSQRQNMASDKNQFLNKLVNWYIANGRVPIRSDLGSSSYSSANLFFGSWSKAIEALKVELHDIEYRK
jgi:hypothetical protein